MNGYGYQSSSTATDPWNRNSAVSKMEHTFWVTKQSVFRKLGKKDDECVVASDAELDAKLELFRSVQDTCQELQRVLDRYQDRLYNLAQEESAMGRFLKEASKRDQTNAGKAMMSVGKAVSYSGQQRLALRVPLQRLHQEVETFRQRAIEDTLWNVSAMERQRTEYRAALSWMKNISQELDPDTFKQLEKFRKVQAQVRQSKANFDKLKLDCLQKVDLLAAARCNMFSHALTLYQTALIQHARRAHRAYSIVAKDIKGYQHYEFMVVPELTEESSRLAKQSKEAASTSQVGEDADKEELLFFDTEYCDKEPVVEEASSTSETSKSDSLQNLLNNGDQGFPPLLIPVDSSSSNDKGLNESTEISLLASDCLNQLDDILGNSSVDSTDTDGNEEWATLFTSNLFESPVSASVPVRASGLDLDHHSESFLPSHLLDQFASSMQLNSPLQPDLKQEYTENVKKQTPCETASPPTKNPSFVSGLMSHMRSPSSIGSTLSSNVQGAAASSSSQPGTSSSPSQGNKAANAKKDMSAWYDLFADLDPLSNPDALDSKILEEERNC